MVLKRNRKLPTSINRCLSTTTRGVQTYETTLSSSLGYTDGWASSIWPMGTNVSFHNTGSSIGGDFGELNKLNYDYLIHFYDGRRRPATITGLSSSLTTGSISCHFTFSNDPDVMGFRDLSGLDQDCSQQLIEFSSNPGSDCQWAGWSNAVWFSASNDILGTQSCPANGTGPDCYGCVDTSLGTHFGTEIGNEGAFEFAVSGSVYPVFGDPDTAAWQASLPSIDKNDRWAVRAGLHPSGAFTHVDFPGGDELPGYIAFTQSSPGCLPLPFESCSVIPLREESGGLPFLPNDTNLSFYIQAGMTAQGYNRSANPYYYDSAGNLAPEAVGGGRADGWSYSAWVSSSAWFDLQPLSGATILRYSSQPQLPGNTIFDPANTKFRIVRNRNPALTSSGDFGDYTSGFSPVPKGQSFGDNHLAYQTEILFQISENNSCWNTFWKENINTLWFESKSFGVGDFLPAYQPFATSADTALKQLNRSYYPVVDFSQSYFPGILFGQPDSNMRTCSFGSASVTNYGSNYAGSPPLWSASISYTYPAGFITNDSNAAYTTTGIYKDYGLMWNVTNERERLASKGLVIDTRLGGGGNPRRYPSYNSYEDYAQDIRSMAKDCTVLPEFKISDFVGNGYDFDNPNVALWSLPGGDLTSSDGGVDSNGNEILSEPFLKEYIISDFLSDFDLFQQQYDETTPQLARQAEITMSCRGVMKLLPYDGFYPMSRTTQLATKFVDSVESHLRLFEYDYNEAKFKRIPEETVNGSLELTAVRKQGITTPFFAPGILYNTIKSGIGLGWTIVTSSCLTDSYYMQNVFSSSVTGTISGNFQNGDFLNTVVYNDPAVAEKIPFEAIYDISRLKSMNLLNTNFDSVDGAFHINYPETLQGYFPLDTSSITASCPASVPFCTTVCSGSGTMTPLDKIYMLGYEGTARTDLHGYSLAMNNFLASTVRFFLGNTLGNQGTTGKGGGGLQTFGSRAVADISIHPGLKKGHTYYMDVILENTNPNATMCESAWPGGTRNLYGSYNASHGKFTARDPNYRGTPGSPSNILDDYPSWNTGPLGLATLSPDEVIRNSTVSFDGRYFGPATRKYLNLYNWSTASEGAHYNVSDPAQAPFTPPYYYGPSTCRIEYTAGDEFNTVGITGNNPLVDVFNNMTMSFFNRTIEELIKRGGLNFVAGNPDWANFGIDEFSTASFAYQMAQNVEDSINLKGMFLKREEVRNAAGVLQSFKNTYDETGTHWNISTKFESPILNFASQGASTMTIAGGLHPTQSFSESNGFLDQTPIGLGKGMWSGYGIANPSVRLRLEHPADVPQYQPGKPQAPENTTNLAEVFGFDRDLDFSTGKSLGTLASDNRLGASRFLAEAVVAIPFTTGVKTPSIETRVVTSADGTISGIVPNEPLSATPPGRGRTRRFAQTINPADPKFSQLDRLLNAGRANDDQIRLFEIDTGIYDDLKNNPAAWLQADRSFQIKALIKNMIRYVFPPELDFVHQDILPFVMYVFPFEHQLNQLDLQDMWQGVLPRIGVKAELANVTIEHSLDEPSDFFHAKRLPANIRWLVFKVKQRSEMDYSTVTQDMLDDPNTVFTGPVRRADIAPWLQQNSLGSNLSRTGQQQHNANPSRPTNLDAVFSYNWPHDFYSLLELGKVEARIKWNHYAPLIPKDRLPGVGFDTVPIPGVIPGTEGLP